MINHLHRYAPFCEIRNFFSIFVCSFLSSYLVAGHFLLPVFMSFILSPNKTFIDGSGTINSDISFEVVLFAEHYRVSTQT